MSVRNRRDEDGATLILVLVIISVFGLLIGLILSEAQVNFRSGDVTGSARDMTYAADGGIEQGINQVQTGHCSSPSATTRQLGTTTFDEPGVNPTVTVTCQNTAGNDLYNTFAGSGGSSPSFGYSVITNSSSAGCVSLATDAIGASNQIKYSPANHCATFGAASTPVYWSANSSGTNQPLNGSSFITSPADGWTAGWAVGNNATILSLDSGNDWDPITCTGCANNLALNAVAGAVYGTSPNTVGVALAVGNSGALVWNNGADNWVYGSGIPNNVNFQAVWASPDGTNFWAVGAVGGSAVVYNFQWNGTVLTPTLEAPPIGSKSLSAVAGVSNGSGYDLVAVGQGGYIMVSLNSGTSWSLPSSSSPTNQDLKGVTLGADLSGKLLGWAVGGGGVIIGSSDGGANTWTAQTSGTNQPLSSVWDFSTSGGGNEVWAAGKQGVIDYSSSFGSWSIESSPGNTDLQSIAGYGDQIDQLHAVGAGGVAWDFNGFPSPTGTPTNNGPAWVKEVSGTNQQLNEVTGPAQGGTAANPTGGNDLYAVGNNHGNTDTILYSTNGTSWSAATISGVAKGQPLQGVSAIAGSNAAWAVGNQGQILATTTGGAWTTQSSSTNQNLNSVFALDPSHVWAVGNNQGSRDTVLFYNGSAWSSQGFTPSGSAKAQPLQSVWASDISNVWAVGNQGQIWHSADGGATWNPQASGTKQNLNGISGLDASHIWAVGNHQGSTETILSYNGTWSPVGLNSNTAQNLNDVHAVTANGTTSVYAVGQQGTVYAYSSATGNWLQQLGGKGKPGPGGPGGPGGAGATNFFGTTATGIGIGLAWAVGQGGAIWNYNPYSPTGMTIDSGGSTWNAGTPQLSSVYWAQDDGYVQGNQPSCPGPPAVTNLYYTTGYTCSSTLAPTVTEALPTENLPPTTNCVPVANHNYSAGCKQNANPPQVKNPVPGCPNYVQFTPGIYNQAPKFAPGTFSFFPSGIYYFDNVGNMVINGNNSTYVVGGTPAGYTPPGQTTSPVTAISDTPSVVANASTGAASSPCWAYAKTRDDNAAVGSSGNGVEFILGGNSDLQVQNGNIELFSRFGGTSTEGTQGISIRESCSLGTSALPAANQIACTGGWDASNLGGNDQILRFNGGSQPAVDIHGSIYAPDHNVEVYSNTNSFGVPTTVGAVDAWTLELASQSYASPAVQLSAAGPLDIRFVIVTATAQGGTGSVPVKEEAFVQMDSPASEDVVDIYTWRACTGGSSPATTCPA